MKELTVKLAKGPSIQKQMKDKGLQQEKFLKYYLNGTTSEVK